MWVIVSDKKVWSCLINHTRCIHSPALSEMDNHNNPNIRRESWLVLMKYWNIFAGSVKYWDESVTNPDSVVFTLSGRLGGPMRFRPVWETPPTEDVCGTVGAWQSVCYSPPPQSVSNQAQAHPHLIKLANNNWYCGHNYTQLWLKTASFGKGWLYETEEKIIWVICLCKVRNIKMRSVSEISFRVHCGGWEKDYSISPCSVVLFHLYNSTAPPAVVTIRK